jgi:two-component system response regulator HydG
VLESELFGHEKGAFTGAISRRKGLFEAADRGTLFLDEVGDLPSATQAKLLRVIENREITRVGGNDSIKVDVRLLAATHRDLREEVKAGRFRQDLFFRLNVVSLRVPPLRERRDDIPLLVDSFIREFVKTHSKDVEGITPEARRLLEGYAWPGNVRELRNCIESMVVMTRRRVLDVADIPAPVAGESVPGSAETPPKGPVRSLRDLEKSSIEAALVETDGNRNKAALILGIGERTLYRKLKLYGLG